jgi:hypothetical protein
LNPFGEEEAMKKKVPANVKKRAAQVAFAASGKGPWKMKSARREEGEADWTITLVCGIHCFSAGFWIEPADGKVWYGLAVLDGVQIIYRC